jgi:DNA-directed RNA polymerase omega subunit
MKLIEGFDSNYRYILVAARRARQLQSGAPAGGSNQLPQTLPHCAR